ncbi:MAG: hypothetical protein IPH88_18630 [Bacteroidales bacterium]|nr:hypothetical protein [Bacteroidales bacterium]
MTQGENIADLAGISMGYEAFMKTSQFKENKTLPLFTCSVFLPWLRPCPDDQHASEVITNIAKSDVHSPAKFRVIGPLSNLPEFCAFWYMGGGMWRDEGKRVKIW